MINTTFLPLLVVVAVAWLLTASAFVLPRSAPARSNAAASRFAAPKDSISAAFEEAASIAEAELEKLRSRISARDAELKQVEKQLSDERNNVESMLQEEQRLHEETKAKLAKQKEESAKILQETQDALAVANQKLEEQNVKIRQLEEELVGKEKAAALEAKRQEEEQAAKAAEEKAAEAKREEARMKAEEEQKAARMKAEEEQKAARMKAEEEQKAAKKNAEEEQRKAEAKRLEHEAKREEEERLTVAALKRAEEEEKEARRKEAQRRTGVPELNDWEINERGEVTALVTGHPTIPDGDTIQTSPLASPELAGEQKTVTTLSGSKYRLGEQKGGQTVARKSNNAALEARKAEQEAKRQAAAQEAFQAKTIELGLTGETAGQDDKYLLAGTPTKSTNGRSWLYTAYQSGSSGMPRGAALALKVSSNKEAMERERANYKKVTGGFGNFKKGMFVVQREFMPEAGGSLGTRKSALVMERGSQDLKQYVRENGPMEGRDLRNAAASAIQCIEALHNSRLVWTDLKTENFIVVPGKGSTPITIKGIDLESAMPVKQNPVDYSPEACPPEFALSHLMGESSDFTLEYSYDIWSLGMLLFELATGEEYFAGQGTPSAIMKVLPGLEPVVEGVSDENMADLISKCLSLDPKKRPSVTEVLLHPYFLTTGVGPFSF